MRRGQDRQKGHIGVSKFADDTDWESLLGEGPVKGERFGVMGA